MNVLLAIFWYFNWHRNGNLKHQAVVERFFLIFREDWVVMGDSVEDFFFGRENYRLHGGRTFVSLTADDLVREDHLNKSVIFQRILFSLLFGRASFPNV